MRPPASLRVPPHRGTGTSRHHQSVKPIAEQLSLCRGQHAGFLPERCLQRDGVYRDPFSRRCRGGPRKPVRARSVSTTASLSTLRVLRMSARDGLLVGDG